MNSVLLLGSGGESRSARGTMDELSQLPSRVAKLESDVAGIKKDVAEIKIDIRRMDDRINAKLDSHRDKIEALQQQISSVKVWALGLYIGLAAGLLLVMAKGFKWI